jgi:hypothetical protein
MSLQPYSRQYLQGLPEMKQRERREKELKEQLDHLFHQISNPVMASAELGETKYLYDMRPWMQQQMQQQQVKLQQQHQQEERQLMLLGRTLEISIKQQKFDAQMQAYQRSKKGGIYENPVAPEDRTYELLAGLKEKFPDCSVSLHEDWVETRQGVKELKKGILVDWS